MAFLFPVHFKDSLKCTVVCATAKKKIEKDISC